MGHVIEWVAQAGLYVWLTIFAALGGLAQYIGKLRQNREKSFSLSEMIGDMFVSGFTGLVTILLCTSQEMSMELTGVAAGITGHQSTRALHILDKMLIAKLPTWMQAAIAAEQKDKTNVVETSKEKDGPKWR